MPPQFTNANRIPDAHAREITIELVFLQSASAVVLSPDVFRRGGGNAFDFERAHDSFDHSGRVDDHQVSGAKARFDPSQFDILSSRENCIHETRSDGKKEGLAGGHVR